MNERQNPTATQAASELLSVASEINRLKDALSAQVRTSQQLDLLVGELQRVSKSVQSLPGAIGSVAEQGLGFIARAETALAPAQEALTGLESLKQDLLSRVAEIVGRITEKVSDFSEQAAESDVRMQELTKAVSTIGSTTARISALLESRTEEEARFRQKVMERLTRLEALETRSGFSKAFGLRSGDDG